MAAIVATDDDSGVNGEITYSVNEDDDDGLFFLNPVTGVFNLTRTLDYETQQYYVLTVRAEDGGGQCTAIRVYFNVLDVNDNPPVFRLSSHSTSLMENLPPGSTVLVFNVTDADDGTCFLYTLKQLPSKVIPLILYFFTLFSCHKIVFCEYRSKVKG